MYSTNTVGIQETHPHPSRVRRLEYQYPASSNLPSEALAHQSGILHGVCGGPSGRESQLIGAVEATSRPTHVAEEDVRVLVQVAELLAHVLLARVRVAAPGLGEHRLAPVVAQPLGQGREGVVDVVGGALGVCAGVVALEYGLSVYACDDRHEWCSRAIPGCTYVQVLVHIKVDVVRGSVRVGDLEQIRSSLGGQGRGGRVCASRDEQPVVGGDLADGGDCGLDGIGPG